ADAARGEPAGEGRQDSPGPAAAALRDARHESGTQKHEHGRPRPDEGVSLDPDRDRNPGRDTDRDTEQDPGRDTGQDPGREDGREDGRPEHRTPPPLPVRNASAPAHGSPSPGAPAVGVPVGAGSPLGGLTRLPRRVPQTSLAGELREDPSSAGAFEDDRVLDDFTAERAASSLAGFQRGTLRAHVDADEPPSGPQDTTAEEAPGPPVNAAGAAKTPTPPADRS
ncbi:histidine kinase, partial [Streptomyces sp. FL07-04A]|nr:histidine kinase [Streptomyces sp. FL07-04A]